MNTSYLAFSALLIALVLPPQASALKSDRDQPAQIEADETEIDFKTGIRTLTENVLVVQGTLRIKADKLVAKYDKGGQLIEAIADGSLARFKQRPDNQPADVEGWAKKISVDYPTNTLTLIGKAALKQGASTARGERIVYNMATNKLKIMGNSNLNVTGKDGTSKPTRKIEDPFKDNVDGPDESTNVASSKKQPSAAKASNPKSGASEEENTKPVKPKQQLEPVKAGRSRLILQPKKIEKKVEKKDPDTDETNDKDE